MSYSSYATKVSLSKESLENTLSSINSISFDTWSGSAHDKLIDDMTKLKDGFTEQLSQMSNLIDALNMIDDYDSLVGQIDDVNTRISNLDSEDGLYTSNYSRLANKLSSLKTSRDSTRESINAKLLAITKSYSSSLSVIDFDSYEDRATVLTDIDDYKSSMSYALDMSNTVKNTNSLSEDLYSPDWSNNAAWVTENPYAQVGLYGQCTWYAWGKFYEIYGYSPGFTGNGKDCVSQLLAAHPDKFESSSTPVAGSVFSNSGSGSGYGHVGIVLAVDGDSITITEGNLNGKTDSYSVAQSDWTTRTVSRSEWEASHSYTYYANPK